MYCFAGERKVEKIKSREILGEYGEDRILRQRLNASYEQKSRYREKEETTGEVEV